MLGANPSSYILLSGDFSILRRLRGPLPCFAPASAARRDMQTIGIHKPISAQGVGRPLGAGNRVDVKHVHGVDLFERATLALNHEKEDDEEERKATTSKHETVEVVDVVGNHRTEERDQEVEQPVGSRGERHANRAVTGRVQLADNSPD